ncbi:MAG: gamma-glutamyl-gamma-aminobutyrate hydrolase family protein [Burkholderiaceae bacterium]
MKSPTQVRPAPVRVAVSARLLHAPPAEMGLRDKKLQYLEESISDWLFRHDALPFVIPSPDSRWPADATTDFERRLTPYADLLDGLLLQGGSDMSPTSYGQTPLQPAWAGDLPRDLYELALVRLFRARGKPILGICRGAQLLNVAFGGTLFQDIETQVAGVRGHVDRPRYDLNRHAVELVAGSWLADWYRPSRHGVVCSIHHQSVDRLGDGLVVEAYGHGDSIVEAFRSARDPYIVGIQWHPEFHHDGELLSSGPIMESFLAACRAAVEAGLSKSERT